MAEKNMFGMLVIGFVVLVIGLALLSTSADVVSSVTDTYTVVNDSFTGISGTGVSVLSGANNMTAVSAVRNSTGDAQTVGSLYNVTLTSNQITVYNPNGTYYADYTYRSNSYITNSAARNVTGLIILMFAIAVMASAIGLIDFKSFGMGKR